MYEKILTKELLEKEYLVNRKAKSQIAREFNTSVHTVNHYLKLYKIETHKRSVFSTVDLTGERFGRLLVIEIDKTVNKHGKIKWICKCDCGKTKIINASSLKRNLSKSCGCLRHDMFHKGYKDISANYWTRKAREADSRGLEFTITQKEVWDLYEKQNRKCAYTGIEIRFYCDSNKPELNTASIDRIDSFKGYTLDNIKIVHKSINLCKNWIPEEEFIALCNLVSLNNPRKPEDCINKFIERILLIRNIKD